MLRLTFIIARVVAAIGGWRVFVRAGKAEWPSGGYCGQYGEALRDDSTTRDDVNYTFLE